MIELRPYQSQLLNEIVSKLGSVNRLCVQLSTGGGKTVIFTELIKQLDSKTLILVDSIDLVNQTISTFPECGTLLAGNKSFPQNKFVVAMVKSLYNRLKANPNLLNDFQCCIVDEAHIWEFNKIFAFLPNAKIIGFTATPVRLKRSSVSKCIVCKKIHLEVTDFCCEVETELGSQLETMSDVYDDIVVGENIEFLIDNGYLVADDNYSFQFDDSSLVVDASGDYTDKSLFQTFKTEEYQQELLNAYKSICEHKKTMIFTSSTELNRIYAELFKDYNVRTYDSNNNKPTERDGIIEWFRNTSDAILINTGCFTKGFDVCDVEAIILARATVSLSLYIQMVGRGARRTSKLFKDKIIVIDGGKNIEKHEIFSFDRDWKSIFRNKRFKEKVLDLIECNNCEHIHHENECPDCLSCNWEQREIKLPKEVSDVSRVTGVKRYEAPKPKAIHVINFCLENHKNKIEALNLISDKWVNYIAKSGAGKELIKRAIANHELHRKIQLHLKPEYLKIIRSQLEYTSSRTLDFTIAKIIKKTKEKYGIN